MGIQTLPRSVQFCLILLFSLATCACERTEPLVRELSSPRGTYVVRLFGILTAPRLPPIEHRVRVQVLRGSTIVVARREIHSADWFDPGFSDEYESSDWPREDTLRFFSPGSNAEFLKDEIGVENLSSVTVRFLKVQARDMFLLFELASLSVTPLVTAAQAPLGDQSWIAAEGEWADGSKIVPCGLNFKLSGHRRGRFRYIISVTKDGARIRQIPIT
jgi:hypothetical protein